MVALIDVVGGIFAHIAMYMPGVELDSQPIPYQERDPRTGKFVTIGGWYEIISNIAEFGISVAVYDAGAADAVAANAVAANAVATDAVATDAVAAEMIKTLVLIILCQGLVNGLQVYGARHVMVDSRTHIINCRNFILRLRVTSPMP
jgi:hypothetical protein